MDHARTILRQRMRRRFRVRRHIRGTAERPRLAVFRTHKHIYAQIIDDAAGRTLVSASTLDKQIRDAVGFGGNKQAAEVIGRAVAERAQAAGLKKVCFDRGEFRYHGRVAALADAARAAGLELATSTKNQAENVMVVDMVRNDLGRIAEVGSVQVSELFTVERYPNVWQMTSLVRARSLAPLADIFSALHPSASVTGAPKVATMELLRALEAGPLGVYTGAVGHVPPDGMASFNVAIRTAVIDRSSSTLTFGIGSGIVWDSEADAEYDECLLKGSVLGPRPVDFELLETLRWSPGEGFVLLERHLQRLQEAAEYFSVPMPRAEVEAALAAAVAEAAGPLRVRLLVSRQGRVRVEQQPFVPAVGVVRVALAPAPVDSSDVSLFHKTTNRRVYDEARASVPGVDEVLLWNAGGEVTEGTTANLVAEIDGVRVTPPIASGLLAGTYRAMLLDAGRVTERVLTIDDLRHATALWLVNSVQGERPVELVD